MMKYLSMLFLLCAGMLAKAQLSFPAATYFPAGNTPVALCSGDFNEDGIADLAVANVLSNDISILTGVGGGVFSLPVNFSVGTNPYCVITGDFNNDQNADLAVGNGNANNVSILLGNGLGSFSSPVNFNTGVTPIGIFTTDFNGDNNQDIVTANSNSNNFTVLLGNGLGGFALSATVPAGTATQSVYSADFNGDSKMDLVGANLNSSNLSVSFGLGNGTFSPSVNYPVGSGPTAVVSALVNNDPYMDIVSSNYDFGTISVMLNNGNGTFAPAVLFPAGYNPVTMVKGDFDGDGNIDIASAGINGDTVTVMLGNGAGGFSAPYSFFSAGSGDGITSADYNNDSRPDLATANSAFLSNNVAVLLNGTPFPLPVHIQSFTGEHRSGVDLIEWVSGGEQNNDFFSLLHSTDGKTFSLLQQISSAAPDGNSSKALTYHAVNQHPVSGHNYYQLQQTDHDGKSSTYSNVLDIVSASTLSVRTYPNPVDDYLAIDLSATETGNATLSIYDLKGRIIRNTEISLKKGSNHMSIETRSIPSGLYQIRIAESSGVLYQQLIRKN